MANTVEFKIQIDGGSIRTVTVDGENLSKVMREIKRNADDVNGSIVNWSQAGQAASLLADVVGQISAVMGKLTGAYAEQVSAETRLAQAMRNTMGATDEEINSIKQLASEQQRLGIIGDEVQLAAAQELATYLEYPESLKTIIPVMNDMIAQQYGFNASAESAAQIASMLGKVMNGQTEALSRYGYKFDEAQKQILKFGDESERAAVLSQLVSESVGGINFAQAETDAGRMKQLSNSIGDVYENMGGVIQRIEPFMSVASSFVIAAAGAAKLATSIKSLIAAVTALRISTAALYATMTLGISVAVTGLVALFTKLGQKGEEAAEGIDDAREAQESYTSASTDMRLRLAEETVKLEDLIKKKKSTAEAVRGLNAEYGNIFGSHATAKEWYEVLTRRSADYCKQLGYEAEAKVRAAKSGRLQVRRDELVEKMESMQRAAGGGLKEKEEFYTTGANMTQIKHERITEYGRLAEEVRKLDTEIIIADTDYRKCMESAQQLSDSLKGQVTDSEEAAKQLEKLADDIKEYRKAVENASAANSVFGMSVSDAEARLSAMRSGLTSLIGKYGTESDSVRQLITEYRELLKARDAANGTLVKPVTVPLEYTVKKMKDGRMKDVTETAYASVQNPAKLTRPKGQKSQRRQAEELYEKLQGMLPDASDFEVDSIRAAMKKLEDLYAGIGRKGEKGMGGAADAVHALSAAMGGLSGVVDDAAASWLSWGANLLQVIGQALPALSSLFAANTSVAGSGAAASVASIPYVGPILAVAAVASIVAAMASLPKFAKGGLAYGPTLGLFGEYPGASGNPEVVAPLSDLTGILAGAGIGGGQLEFVIKGRRLVAINDKMNRYYGRNGQ